MRTAMPTGQLESLGTKADRLMLSDAHCRRECAGLR
jgi:hypothetical protein